MDTESTRVVYIETGISTLELRVGVLNSNHFKHSLLRSGL